MAEEHRRDASVVIIDTRAGQKISGPGISRARAISIRFRFIYSDSSERGIGEFKDQLRWIFSALGITTPHTVVFYENDSGMRATRVAWALEWMGHPKAQILDGGLKALAGEKLVTQSRAVRADRLRLKPREELSHRSATSSSESGGARCKFSTCAATPNITASACALNMAARFPAPSISTGLRVKMHRARSNRPRSCARNLQALGLRPEAEVIPYCQGGYRAAHAYYALKLAGYSKVRNYLGFVGRMGQSRRRANRASSAKELSA